MRWLIATLALAATIAVIAATLPPNVEALSPDEALLSLFPPDSGGVIFVDVARLRDNPLVRENFLDRPGFEMPNRVAEFARGTGLDPETDVDQVMFGRTGENDFLGVARANYDPLNVERYFRDLETSFESYAGRTIYHPSPGDFSVSFIDDLVLVGEVGPVRGAIDRMGISTPSVLESPELMEAIQSIDEGNQVWGVGNLTDVLLPEAMGLQWPPI